MEWMYLGMVIFLFLLAAFDIYVGVSNDAVNFLNSAIGSKAAKFRTLVIIASVGIFAGCVLSNGMMDIARHGIFTPQYFSFNDVMIIFMAVMVTDIVLLDVFNTFGMPTSTTVSMVFELLGAAFAFVIVKMIAGDMPLGFGDYLNTSKALEVIMGIFMSVPIAFIFGTFVQYIARIIFSFDFKRGLTWKIGIFGGIALTAIVYFMLFKGLKDLSFMDKDVKAYINENVVMLLSCCFVGFTVLMQILHACKVNVFRIIVLCGTFALATAFAGNDLVNFLGVSLAGYDSYLDFTANANGVEASSYMMHSLQTSAQTPFVFLAAAGVLMVFSLATSKKARHVVKTEVGLARKDEGDEMFGSSRAARSLVRWSNSAGTFLANYTPAPLARFIDRRFQKPVAAAEDNGAAFDMVRASVNLVVASLLIAGGTSLKLPLSTTFVTFMVAMGSSLADRAWSRESAVFRITGVLTVVGGWFLTAGVAFAACFFVALLMHLGGIVAIVLIVGVGIYAIIHSQQRYVKKQREAQNGDVLFNEMLTCDDQNAIIPMLNRHLNVSTGEILTQYAGVLRDTTEGLFSESLRRLRRSGKILLSSKRELKNLRRRETICLRRSEPMMAVRVSTTFHLVHNALRQMLYGIMRINDPALEHVDNHFTPISQAKAQEYAALSHRLSDIMERAAENLRNQRIEENEQLRDECNALRHELKDMRNNVLVELQTKSANMTSKTLLLHLIQETEQLCSEVSMLLKSVRKIRELS